MTTCSTLDKKIADVSEETGVKDMRFLLVQCGGIIVVDYILNIIHFPCITQLF